MKRVEAFQTLDGMVHATREAARKYAEARHGGAMVALRDGLMNADANIGHSTACRLAEWLSSRPELVTNVCDLATDIVECESDEDD
jgi:hypothetical protein